ncbi:hypothetical protein SCOR_35205 [Sulfidibacter corallicola]|uniref:AAA ATPase domain-containing protein n=1 Tax=Sulfidibacter corallicola TaxID=2818388 RepID=A0A8A4TK30_SULCO|nr:hypothetical protein [Sulfidibacter corallicola]QTD49221.1 hypothetical protein J3U87_26855 [Sulfidibacter corallicola]
MTFEPPKDIWDTAKLLEYDRALGQGHELYLDLTQGRGEFSLRPMLRELGVSDKGSWKLRGAHDSQYLVLCGHRGCGKSTELRKLAGRLHGQDLFFVVFTDILERLDPQNLQYTDVLMASAGELLHQLAQESISIEDSLVEPLKDWFYERVKSKTNTQDFELKTEAGVQAKQGLPFLASLFAKVTASFKSNATYKTELRKAIKNSFTDFAAHFNKLLAEVQKIIHQDGLGHKVLFIIDGTDRLNGEDAQRFFIEDANQLQLIAGNFLYCAPIHLLHTGNQLQTRFKTHMLPMVKLHEKDDETHLFEPGYRVLRDMALRRADISLFDSEETLAKLVRYSGGNPRELIRLMSSTFSLTETELFDDEAVEKAMDRLAADFDRWLGPQDYQALHQIDEGHEPECEPERINNMLYNLALLEYNSYWRRSHPAVRRISHYRKLAEGTES